MPDIFISHSSHDRAFAEFLKRHLQAERLSVYLASVSLQPGERWSEKVLEALRTAEWVICLASRAACTSGYVQQEMGGAILTKKRLIPIVWDLSPEQLPGWMPQYQAVNLAGANALQVRDRLSSVAGHIKAVKQREAIIAVLLVGGLVLLLAAAK